MRNIKGLPKSPRTVDDWREWKRQVIVHRLQVLADTDERNPEHIQARAREIRRCADDYMYMANVYGTIYEARPDEDGHMQAGYLPFIMYPFQIEVWDWFEERVKSKGAMGDGLAKKAREMGLSNIAMFWMGTHWLIDQVFQGRVGSRVEALVDQTGDPDSLFFKLDTYLQGMPNWLLMAFAPGFSWRKHRREMQIRNPRTGNTIKGESTTANLGRGGRATCIIYDEAAFMDNFGVIWTAGRAASRHRIAISTVNISNGLDFYNLNYGKEGYTQPSILEIPWNAHPEHDEVWFQNEVRRDTPDGIKQEVLMDYFAGTGEWVYPDAHKKEVGDFPYEPMAGPVFGAIDDGYDDEWCMHLIQYNVRTGRHRVLESYRNSHKKVDHYASMMTGIPRSDILWGEEEMPFIRLVQQLPGITWIGDPHIKSREQITGMSVFEHISKNWNIHVMFDMDKRDHKDRWVALSHLIPMFDFNDTPGVSYALEALKRNRYPKPKSGSSQMTEANKPIHDDTSHPTTAFEWYAVNFVNFTHLSGSRVVYEGPDNL